MVSEDFSSDIISVVLFVLVVLFVSVVLVLFAQCIST